ncbi:MAG: tRNA (adenosine(37)-N6)-threonylcarbamoyltransferase complex ATPase subunit type 1 TsaE [Desulfobacterales bacterium]
MDVVIVSKSVLHTREIGEKIGRKVKAGNVIRLIGDLGSGKTSMVQGIAKGLKVPPEYYVTSPTFTLINEYPGRHTLYHVDLYRLNKAVDFEDIGLLDLLFEDGVVAIEWAEKLKEELENQITINMNLVDDKSRIIQISSLEPEMVELLKKLENQNKVH